MRAVTLALRGVFARRRRRRRRSVLARYDFVLSRGYARTRARAIRRTFINYFGRRSSTDSHRNS